MEMQSSYFTLCNFFQFLQALLSPVKVVNRVAAQVIGAFGAVDYPNNQWPHLIATLVGFVSNETISAESKAATLEVFKAFKFTMSGNIL